LHDLGSGFTFRLRNNTPLRAARFVLDLPCQLPACRGDIIAARFARGGHQPGV
jgi:hypothetical protein